MTQLAERNGTDMAAAIEKVLITGDLRELTAAQRVHHYNAVCASLGLNPLTRPFEYLVLNGKTILYARKDCTDQLRAIRGISVQIVARERTDDLIVVTARATTQDGRCDESIGAVAIGALKGEALANALMKSETKSKRRATLSICGLGISDESEVDSIPGAVRLTLCDTCGNDIKPARIGGVARTAEEVAAHMVEAFGTQLCVPCAKAAISGREAPMAAVSGPSEELSL